MRHSVHSIFYDQAADQEEAGRYDAALTLLYQVHRWAPEDPELWLRMGVLSFLMTDRGWLSAHGHEGSHLADMGAVNADLYLSRACELAPGLVMPAFWRGWIRHALYQDAAGARESLEAALAIDPHHPYAHAALGRMALAAEEDRTAEAELHLRKAIARLPESARFHYDLGTCLARRHQNEEAKAAFAAAAAAPPLPPPAHPDKIGALGRYLHLEFHGHANEIGAWARRFYADVLGNEPFQA
jgi:tetratricopeptide (TPR) repeat protein